MRIVVDAMGSDQRPIPDVEGAVLAAQAYGDTMILVGDEALIKQELAKYSTSGLKIEVVHAPEQILMTDKPSKVMKTKPHSSIHIGTMLVKDGHADAFVTCGNTGAAHAISTLSTLKRIRGVKRPALTAIYPFNGFDVILLDVGANADSKIEWLLQYAVMGNAYAKTVLNRPNPRVATLSNGEEEGKGNQMVKDVQEQMRKLPFNYIGHVEPREITEQAADVVIMDGFVGNIFIKTYEAGVRYMGNLLRSEIRADVVSTAGGLLARGAFNRMRSKIDPRNVGGVPLLGVDGVVIIAHGGSDGEAVKGAINQARLAVKAGLIDEIKRELNGES